jgi:hypothetical protein
MVVLDRLNGFDWDSHNAGHVDRRGVEPTEVEEAALRPSVIVPAKDAGLERRWKLFGKSAAGDIWSSCSRFGING